MWTQVFLFMTEKRWEWGGVHFTTPSFHSQLSCGAKLIPILIPEPTIANGHFCQAQVWDVINVDQKDSMTHDKQLTSSRGDFTQIPN